MRRLAELAMGKLPVALLIVLLLMVLPLPFAWLGVGCLALRVLRQGACATWLFWLAGIALGSALYLWLGNGTLLMLCLATVLLAQTLRTTQSWQYSLLMALVLALLSGWAVLRFPILPKELIGALQAQLHALGLKEIGHNQIMYWYASFMYLQLLVVLLLGRWWQAVLYNPGGLRAELHGFQLSKNVSLCLLLLLIFAYFRMPVLIGILAWPLIFAGTCLVHHFVARHRLSWWVLLPYYILLIFGGYPLVIGLALMDSFFDLQGKMAKSGKS